MSTLAGNEACAGVHDLRDLLQLYSVVPLGSRAKSEHYQMCHLTDQKRSSDGAV